MLLQLQIENIAIIEKLAITLNDGFNVLTGETGAGKSIIIDSLNTLLGSRVSRELIRSGADKATVQGVFSIEDNTGFNDFLESLGIEPQEDNTLLISRTFNEAGKNFCRVNGTLATVAMLREIGQRLVDIHGQHDNQSLLRPETHIELLDLFAGEELTRIKAEYRTKLDDYRSLKARLKALSGEGKERERLIDMLKYQIQEIEEAGLFKGEDTELEQQSKILSHAEEIISSFSRAYELIHGDDTDAQSAMDKLGEALDALYTIKDIDPEYASICEALEEVHEKLGDISREVRIVRDGTEYDPMLHKQVEERISLIQGLKRKYGETIDDILLFCNNAREHLDEIERSEELISGIKKDIEDSEKTLHKLCERMNQLRGKAAVLLETGIKKELSDLEMPRSNFEVSVISCPDEGFNENGTDKVEFLFSPNPGEPVKPLSKIASGGEMSRVMLAIKSILADIDAIPTLVFDEIDTGVSGKAASKVGEKLKSVARGHQVICITHHAQIACMADAHYLIHKEEQAGRTLTFVNQIEGQERENEITRLLSGEHVTENARALARELLNWRIKDKQ